jgi:polyisoprenoid-binding protein YceI
MNPKLSLLLAVMLFSAHGVFPQPSTFHLIKDESSVTYRLVHPLHKIESTSNDVMYRLDVDITTKEIRRVSALVDVTTFSSGNSNRDSHAMEVIDAISYPEARFSSTSISQHGDSLTVTGMLTFHGVTKEVVMKAAANWLPNKLVVQGNFDVSLAAFNIERPSLLLIPVEDTLSFGLKTTFEWN